MPLMNYGVFKGSVLDRKAAKGRNPHYEIHGLDDDTHFRVSVNVRSKLHPSELLYFVEQDFRHPITSRLPALSLGFTRVRTRPGGIALDYIRGNLFNPVDMKALPHEVPGPCNDLNDLLDHTIQRAIEHPGALIYAFGHRWGPLYRRKDKVFGFTPRNGIHDIHMNQGSHPIFQARDGVWQDGGLLIEFPRPRRARDRWVAMFLAFQSQAWQTDDRTGRAITAEEDAAKPGLPRVQIVAAMVHPENLASEAKTVTLLNGTSAAIDLTRWALSDVYKNVQPLEGSIPAGEIRVIPIDGRLRLSSQGGVITLLDKRGIKVDGVSYGKSQGRKKGAPIMF
jgi:uncharacterized protein YukJ